MLTREEIISSFKKVDFPEKIIESTSDVKNIIFYSESTEPKSQKEKDTKNLSDSNNNFNRGSNFIPKEQLVEIKIENFKLIYDQYFIPLETGMIYFKNNYGGMNGPYNYAQLQNMYKNKKFDSSFEFRPIDLFVFKDCDNFKFKSIKIINENNWIDSIVYSPLLKYYKSSDDNKEEKKLDNHELTTPKPKVEDKVEDKKEDKNKEIIKNEISEKKEEKLEEKKIEIKEKEEKKEDKKEEKKEIIKKEPEQKWEVVQKKKNKANKEKEEEEDNEIIGLKPKNSKEGKKAKKKKKQFEDVDFELGFKIK